MNSITGAFLQLYRLSPHETRFINFAQTAYCIDTPQDLLDILGQTEEHRHRYVIEMGLASVGPAIIHDPSFPDQYSSIKITNLRDGHYFVPSLHSVRAFDLGFV